MSALGPCIVSAARGWIGTPYLHQASCRGAGTDCLGLLRGVWRDVLGEEPEAIPPYSMDWSEPAREEQLWQAAARHLVPKALGDEAPGDVLLFRMRQGMVAKHLGLAAEVGPKASFIHAYSGHAVLESPFGPPWRGRITTAKAPGQPGSTDETPAAAAEVAAFFGTVSAAEFPAPTEEGPLAPFLSPGGGNRENASTLFNHVSDENPSPVVYEGPEEEWSYRRFILHQAALCRAAGGVESFCIGSEMRGLTQIRGASNSFPAVAELIALAAEVRIILGSDVKLSYAADWSEYFGYQPEDGSGSRYFHLDPLWADDNIDFIGIDNYMPLSDWRDGADHADAHWGSIYNEDYLRTNVMGGEGYDWYYHSSEARAAQIRTAITDAAHDEPWVFRYKDIRSWWENAHFERIEGIRQPQSTPWVPQSKPIRFTEYGCAAIDKGTNQPNKFLDPKSSESSLPYFSNGRPDDLIQAQYLQVMSQYWNDPENNPLSEEYEGRMLDFARSCVWAWDARPYPWFPNNRDLWRDGANHARGHWLNGRISGRSLASVVDEICQGSDAQHFDVSALHQFVRGYGIQDITEARAALQPLMLRYGFDAIERAGKLTFRLRDGKADAELAPDWLVRDSERDAVIEETRGSAAELAGRVRLRFVEADGDYAVISEEAILPDERSQTVSISEVPLAMTRGEGRQTVTLAFRGACGPRHGPLHPAALKDGSGRGRCGVAARRGGAWPFPDRQGRADGPCPASGGSADRARELCAH